MRTAEAVKRLNRLQKTTRFKVVATILVVALAVAGFSTWWITVHAPAQDAARAPAQTETRAQTRAQDDAAPEETATPLDQLDETAAQAEAETDDDESLRAESGTLIDQAPVSRARSAVEVLGSRDATVGVAIGTAVGAGVALVVVWLGLALTYLAIAVATTLVAGPLLYFEPTRFAGTLVAGGAILTASFAALLEAARAILFPSHPVTAIARTVVDEAVRMKISLVFIVLLIAWLTMLPGLLDADQPLRFRVQTFLRNGAEGSFWVLGLLTLFFTTATVAFDQRDRTIWQTVSKPVAAWHYVLGKWTGVMTLNLVLLGVTAGGVFLFTEYLRSLPADGEVRPYVSAAGPDQPSRDRLILESQVLTARAVREPQLERVTRESIRPVAERRIERTMLADPSLDRAAVAQEIYDETLEEAQEAQTAIAPGGYRDFLFTGLGEAKAQGKPITLRYRLNAGVNDPSSLYKMRFVINGTPVPPENRSAIEASLDVAQVLTLKPAAIDDGGEVRVRIYNGDPVIGWVNPLTIRFPPGGLEILYPAGGYEANFARVFASQWVKLGFVAAAGVFGATFLSFPVACLLGFLVLFGAETAGYLKGSLEAYTTIDREGEVQPLRVVIRAIALPISKFFAGYRDLEATRSLVEGRLLSWGTLTSAGGIVLAMTAGFLAMAIGVFRNRELAIYSGN